MPDTELSGRTITNLNLRSGPGINFAVITTLPPNTEVTINGQEGAWYKVTVNGQEGYVSRAHVTIANSLTGFLINQPQLNELPLPPQNTLTPSADANPNTRTCISIWNRFGGLVGSISQLLGIDRDAGVAVMAAESRGAGFENGRMVIRFENHKFYKHWGRQTQNRATFLAHFKFGDPVWTGHKFRLTPDQNWQTLHVDSQNREWSAFELARTFDDRAAKASISLGLPQVMGENFDLIGYQSPIQMFDAFNAGERAQILGMFDFIKGNSSTSVSIEALRRRDFQAFAAQYNGAGNAAVYGQKIRTLASIVQSLLGN